jgi:hypothetical protein
MENIETEFTLTKIFALLQDWMVHINKCIKDLLEKGGKKAADEHAAVWVPDSAASACMTCQKSQFSMINRRVRRSYLRLKAFK